MITGRGNKCGRLPSPPLVLKVKRQNSNRALRSTRELDGAVYQRPSLSLRVVELDE